MGQKMADTWGQQVVIDNRPGAGGNLAAELALKSPADGYTIIIVGMSHAVNISIYPKLNYDPVRDFAGVTQVASVETFLAVHPSLPVKTVKELVALARGAAGRTELWIGWQRCARPSCDGIVEVESAHQFNSRALQRCAVDGRIGQRRSHRGIQ
jgi:hypothetical protein